MLHTVAAFWSRSAGGLIGQVSLFEWTKYLVRLGDGFIVKPTWVGSGHAFDPFTLDIRQMTTAKQPQIDLAKAHKLSDR